MGVAAVGRSTSRRDMGVVGGIRASREGYGRKGEYMGARDRTLAHSYTARGRKEEYICAQGRAYTGRKGRLIWAPWAPETGQ